MEKLFYAIGNFVEIPDSIKHFVQMMCSFTLNRNIVKLGHKFDRPIIATGEVHYLNPEDAIIRKRMMLDRGYSKVEFEEGMYFRTTEEMLQEFEYLGKDIANEIVIENTNLIADKIEEIDEDIIYKLNIFKE